MKTSAPIEALEVKNSLPYLVYYDKQTDQLTNQKTDLRVNREVTLPINENNKCPKKLVLS